MLARFEAGASEAVLLAFVAGPMSPIPPLQHQTTPNVQPSVTAIAGVSAAGCHQCG